MLRLPSRLRFCAIALHAVLAQIAYATTVIDAQWSQGIIVAGRQRLLIERATLEFLKVAKRIDTAASKAGLTSAITTFEFEHNELKDGSADNTTLAKAPTQDIVKALSDLEGLWPQFKAFLEANINSGSIGNNKLKSLNDMNGPLIDAADVVATRYTDAASGAEVKFSSLQVNTASRQSFLSTKMGVEVFLLNAGIDSLNMLDRIEVTRNLFAESHVGILEGLDFVGLAATTNKCILQQMRTVTYLWDNFNSLIEGVLFDKVASNEDLAKVATQTPALVTQAELATTTYAKPPSSCPVSISNDGWISAIDISTRGLMYAQKASRLFLQAAKGVNTLDSRVLFSNADVSAQADIKLLQEGSQDIDMPSAVTQSVATIYGTMGSDWAKLGGTLAINIQSVTSSDTRQIALAEEQTKAFVILGEAALQEVVTQCREKTQKLPCTALYYIGRQRYLIQKSAFQAVLLGLDWNVESNKEQMTKSIELFEQSHIDLVHGRQPNITRTTDICTLNSLKKLDDLWIPFKAQLDQVHLGDHSVETLLKIWGMTWNAGVDPFEAQIFAAFKDIAQGGGNCTLTATRIELESAIKNLGLVRAFTQKCSKFFFLVAKGLDVSVNRGKLTQCVEEFGDLLGWLISGYTPKNIPVPVLQDVANRLFVIGSDWGTFETMLGASNVEAVSNYNLNILTSSEDAMTSYVDAAWDMETEVPGLRSNLMSKLLMLVEKMSKDAVLVGLGKGSKRTEIASSIISYESNVNLLRNGNGALGKTSVKATDEEDHTKALEAVATAWASFSPRITQIANGGDAGDFTLREILSKGETLEKELLDALDLYSTMTVTTTKIPVDMLIPLPFTGRYTPGDTLKTSTLVALDIINRQQKMLPGYQIFLDIFDSECNKDTAQRQTLAKFASSEKWVSLGGMACTEVCETAAVVSNSLMIPTASMDCPGDILSDAVLFPDFVRIAIRTTIAKDVIVKWAQMFSWDHIAIVSGDPIFYRAEAQELMNFFTSNEVESNYYSTMESDWGGIVAIMRGLNGAKRRRVMVLGDEPFFRKVICASSEVDMRVGLVWLSVGQQRTGWWTIDDPELIKIKSTCTGAKITELFQGALSIAGMGVPEDPENSDELGCFEGYTSKTLLSEIKTALAEGYPTKGENVVDKPFEQLIGAGADGLCVLVKCVKYMLDIGYKIEDLRSPRQEVYRKATDYIRNSVQFPGASGEISFGVGTDDTNDRAGRVGLFQVVGSTVDQVGYVAADLTINTGMEFGLKDQYWTPAYAGEDIDLRWKKGIVVAGRQRLLVQKITMEFLQVAKKMSTADSKAAMMASIKAFEDEHKDLTVGSADGTVVPAPTQDIGNALVAVQELWVPFKAYLVSKVDLPSIDNNTVGELNDLNIPLVAATEVIATRYVDAANGDNAGFSGLQVNTASRQGMLLLKMSVETFLLNYGIDGDAMLTRLAESSQLFGEAHAGVLEGQNFVGLSATTDKCILQQMCAVTFLWEKFKFLVDAIFFSAAATDADLKEIVNKTSSLLNETAKATETFANPPAECPVTVSRHGWVSVIDVSTRQLTYAQKAARLFLQAAKRVNTLDSRVLFSNAEVSGTFDLKLLREGLQAIDMPSPVTTQVSREYGSMWVNWLTVGTLQAENINTVSDQDDMILSVAEVSTRDFVQDGLAALDQVIAECKRVTTGIPCTVLQVAGRQRLLIQKVATEAVLVGLQRSLQANKAAMIETIDLFELSHFSLVHGNTSLDLPRTSNICTLQEMKNTHDLWLPFKTELMKVHGGDLSIATLLSIWSMTWNAGVDPIYSQISKAMDLYAAGGANCTLTATRKELESGIRNMGLLRAWTQKMSTFYLLFSKGLDPEENAMKMNAVVQMFGETLGYVISGYTPKTLPVPVTQTLANSLFLIADGWPGLQTLLKRSNVNQVIAAGTSTFQSTEAALNSYIDTAWLINPDVPGARSALASKLLMLIQQMCKDAVMVSIGKAGARTSLMTAIADYEASKELLMNGNSLVGKNAIPVTDEREHQDQMKLVDVAWGLFEPRIRMIANGGAASDEVMREIVSQGEMVETEVLGAIDLYSTMTVTTTKIPVDMLIPLPFTGMFTPGPTMQVATMVARDIINRQQKILPGYKIFLEFVDDRCDKDWAMRQVLSRFAADDRYVALGGMACTVVCESLAVISNSMNVPTTGMDCPGDILSDTLLFPDFTRLGVRTTQAQDVIIQWAQTYGWDHIGIVSGDPAVYRDDANKYSSAFKAADIDTTYVSALENNWLGITAAMRGLDGAKRRVIMVLGDEKFFRKLVCASDEVDMRMGLVWLSVGAQRRGWWTLDDPEVMALNEACTGEKITELFQGALSITGLGTPEDANKDRELTCFDGYTSAQLLAEIEEALANGYPLGTNNTVSNPYTQLISAGADGLCVLVKAIRFMLDQGYKIEQLRSPEKDVFRVETDFIRNSLMLIGASGEVSFGVGTDDSNDRPGRLGCFQVRGKTAVQVGVVGFDFIIRTGESYGLSSASWLPAFEGDDVDARWKRGIVVAGRQRLLVQKMTLQFLMIAKGMDVDKNRDGLQESIVMFDAEHKDLVEGSADGVIVPAPTEDITRALLAVSDLWNPYKALLVTNMKLNTIVNTTLFALDDLNGPLVSAADVIATRYVDAANGAGAGFSALQVNTASRQGMLTQKMAVEAFFANLGIGGSSMIGALETTSKLFGEAHAGILEGLGFVGLSATTSRCILMQMRHVTYLWNRFKFVVDGILFDLGVDQDALTVIAEQITDLLNQTELATEVYAYPPDSCAVAISSNGWKLIIDFSTASLTYAQKASRLFMQAAKRVNTLDSRVLFSNAEESATSNLKLLREGSQVLDLPAPITESVSAQYGTMWSDWNKIGAALVENINTVSASDDRILSSAEADTKKFIADGLKALESVLLECQKQTMGAVPCTVLRDAGRQRLLIQKQAFEAVLVGLNRNLEVNRAALMESINMFDTSHYNLVHGHGPYIPRTTNICTLQAMKDVDDLWIPFRRHLMKTYNGDHSVDNLLSIWSMTWNAGVDPMYDQITKAIVEYANGGSTCEIPASRLQIESAIRNVGVLREWTQAMCKYFLMVARGFDKVESSYKLHNTTANFSDLLAKVISGYTPKKLPVPIVQEVADRLFGVAANWSTFYPLISKSTTAIATLLEEGALLLASTEDAMDAYVDAAWIANPDVPGSRSNLASRLGMLIQMMSKDAVLASFNHAGSRERLLKTLNEYKAAKTLLTCGSGGCAEEETTITTTAATQSSNGARLLSESEDTTVAPGTATDGTATDGTATGPSKDDIKAMDEESHTAQMKLVDAAWADLETTITDIANGAPVTIALLDTVDTQAKAVDTEVSKATELFSTMTLTTTKIPVDILVPLPLSGSWAPGATMRTATMVAQDIINQQQLMLPGYRIKVEFMDSRCDKEHAMREVLAKFASSDNWVALGGMACSSVCESLAVISSSMWIPTVSMDCSAEALSDTELYPDFVRLGVKTKKATDVIIEWAKMFTWSMIAVLSQNAAKAVEAASFTEEFSTGGVGSTSTMTGDDWSGISSTMGTLLKDKVRVIMVIGDESYFRKVVCASNSAGLRKGVAWLSVGITQESWWTVDDSSVMDNDPQCTGSFITDLMQGALSITGLDTPENPDNEDALDCFEGYTSATLRTLISDGLQNGYPDGTANNTVEAAHQELIGSGPDGLCVIVKMVRHMIDQGIDIAELRSPQQNVYRQEVQYVREQLEFTGVSGKVKFEGNDKPGRLGLWQISGNDRVPVGSVDLEDTILTGYYLGLRNESWTEAFADKKDDPFPVLYVIIPCVSLLVCCPCCLAWYTVRRDESLGRRGGSRGLFSFLSSGSKGKPAAAKENNNNGNMDAQNIPLGNAEA